MRNPDNTLSTGCVRWGIASSIATVGLAGLLYADLAVTFVDPWLIPVYGAAAGGIGFAAGVIFKCLLNATDA